MQCITCHHDKPAGDFYAGDRSCKLCRCAKVRAYRKANLEMVRAYDRERGSLAHRVQARAAYQKTEAFRLAHDRASRRYAGKHPDRYTARNVLNAAVRDGKVNPWPVCAMPECSDKPEAHHPDYSAPLLVVWLCSAHHKQAHALTRNHYRENA